MLTSIGVPQVAPSQESQQSHQINPTSPKLRYALAICLLLIIQYPLYLIYQDLFQDYINRCRSEFGGIEGWTCIYGMSPRPHNDILVWLLAPIVLILLASAYSIMLIRHSSRMIAKVVLIVFGGWIGAFGFSLLGAYSDPPIAPLVGLVLIIGGMSSIIFTVRSKFLIATILAIIFALITMSIVL